MSNSIDGKKIIFCTLLHVSTKNYVNFFVKFCTSNEKKWNFRKMFHKLQIVYQILPSAHWFSNSYNSKYVFTTYK